ncbi:MAG: response regulator [Acidobacteria bacterium]|nr:response regulator [Acidobacteriota bacterium]
MNDAPIRILFVDNQVDAREWLAEWLHRVHKFEVDTASDSTESIRLVQEARGNYDVILMDLLLDRGSDGIETMKVIRGLYPRVETIIITGFGCVDDGVKAMQAGAYRYVLKPLNKEELVVYIRHAAERRRLLSEASRSKVYETFSALRMGLDPNTVMHRFVEKLSGQFNLTTCTIALLDPDKTHLDVVAESGLGRRVVKYLKDLPGDVSKVLDEHEPLTIPNLDNRLDWKRALTRPDLKSFTILPLCGKAADPIGVITMGRTEPSEWTEEDLHLLKSLADQAAADIENARLDEERENWERLWETLERAQLLETLDRASLDIADPSEAKDVLFKTIQGATEMLQASGGGIYLFKSTNEDEQLTVEKSYGVPHMGPRRSRHPRRPGVQQGAGEHPPPLRETRWRGLGKGTDARRAEAYRQVDTGAGVGARGRRAAR